jgi:hypothetical protein
MYSSSFNILVVIGTDYIDSYKSNYHTTMNNTASSEMCILGEAGGKSSLVSNICQLSNKHTETKL